MKSRVQQRLQQGKRQMRNRFFILLVAILFVSGLIYYLFYYIPNPIRVKGYVYEAHLFHDGLASGNAHPDTYVANFRYWVEGKEYVAATDFIITNRVSEKDSIWLIVSKSDPTIWKIEGKFYNGRTETYYSQD